MLIVNSYNLACTSKSSWMCCSSEASNVTFNMLIMHSVCMLSQQHSIAAEAYPEQTFGAALPAAAGLPPAAGAFPAGLP